MEANFSSSSFRQESFWKIFAAHLVVFFLLCVLPVQFLLEKLGEFDRKLEELGLEKKADKSNEVLAGLERALDTTLILKDSLVRFRKFVERRLAGRSLGKTTIPALEKSFKRIFPAESLLVWFDSTHHLVPFVGNPAMAYGSRSWQAFYECLIPGRSPDAMQMRISEGMILRVMGDLASLNILKKALQMPLRVFFQKRVFSFAVLRFRDPVTKHLLGAALVFIPLDRARPNWELERAIRLLPRKEPTLKLELGGLWLSDQTGTSTSALSPGLMMGFWSMMQNASRSVCLKRTSDFHDDGALESRNLLDEKEYVVQDEVVYWTKLWRGNPDLLLSVGIERDFGEMHVPRAMVFGLGMLCRALLFFLAMVFFFPLTGRWQWKASLDFRFRLMTMVIAGVPLMTLLVLGFTHSLTLHQVQAEEGNRQLDNLLYALEQSVGREQGAIGRRLNELLSYVASGNSGQSKKLDRIFELLKAKLGLESILFVPPDRDLEVRGGNQANPSNQIFSTMVIDKLGFGRYPKSFKKMNSISFEGIFEKFTPQEFLQTMDRFEPIGFGAIKRFVFHTFICDIKGGRLAYFAVFFNDLRLRDFLLNRARARVLKSEAAAGVLVSIKSLGDGAGKGFTQKNRLIREWLSLVAYTGKPLSFIHSGARGDLQILARPLKGLDAIALLAAPLKGLETSAWLIIGLFALFPLLGWAGAWVSSDLLKTYLLDPVLSLEKLVRRVDGGDYQVQACPVANDELGKISLEFNQMVLELRQKERMTSFVRRDLVESVIGSHLGAVEKKRVAVSFSGIRRFSEIESRLSPRAAMAVMTHFLGLCEESVKRHGGEIDKFIGDTAMAVFVDNRDVSSSRRALLAAIDLHEAVKTWTEERRRHDLPAFHHGTGIAFGEVIAGQVGSTKKRLDFTLIGDTVNLAARLEKLAGTAHFPTILVTGEVRAAAGGDLSMLPVNITTVRGRKGQIEVFGVGIDSGGGTGRRIGEGVEHA